ncbi:MAG: c-type cytochrome [Gammaproteobacteria bacterium]|jgi:mono/diheme cytochrome c family protein
MSKQYSGWQGYHPLLAKLISIIVLSLLISQSVTAQQISESELAGKKLFLQRCSVCHMPAPLLLNDPELPTIGPKLEGYIKDANTENRMRAVIRDGTTRMPGFRYGLTETDMDYIVTYLKIFKLSDFIHPGVDVGGGPDKIVPIDNLNMDAMEETAD